jgi:hypothetical protein
MILTEVYRVGMLRNEHDQPPPFHVYIDEFGQHTTPVVAKALDEIRKKSVYLTVAHQHIAQLMKDDTGIELVSSIMTNCLVRVAFGGLTPKDASLMTERMWTPHIDLKDIKHQQFSTKTRHVEETRTSMTKGRSSADGTSHTKSQGETWSDGYSDGTSDSETHTQTDGGSESRTRADTTGNSSGTTWSDGKNQSHTFGEALSKGSSRAHGTNDSSSETKGSSSTIGEAETNSSSRSNSSGHSLNASSSSGESRYSHGDGLTESAMHNSGSSQSNSSSDSEGESRTRSNSRTESESATRSAGKSQTDTKSFTETKNQSDTDGTSSSLGGSENTTTSRSQGVSEGTSHSEGHAQSRGTTHTDTHSEGGSKGVSDGISHTETASESETTSPFYRIEEYQEETSRSFYSLPEQFHRKTGALMALTQGTALFQFDAAVPAELKTKRLDDVPLLKYGRARKLERFRQRMIEANGRYYTTANEIEKASIARQMKAFEKPLAYEDSSLEDFEIIIDESISDDGFNTQ